MQRFKNTRKWSILLWLIMLASTPLLFACIVRETPPGPSIHSGLVDDVAYVVFRWPDGETVMLWDDIVGNHQYGGGASSSESVYKQRGEATSADGRSYQFQMEKAADQLGKLTIEGQAYNLMQGTLFLIRAEENQVRVEQVHRDLSTMLLTEKTIETMAVDDASIAKFIDDVTQNSPTSPEVTPTPTPLPNTPTPECLWEPVPAEIFEIEPATAKSGTEIALIAQGGYLQDNCGGYNESPRTLPLYLDDRQIGDLHCHVGSCRATVTIPPSTPSDTYCLSGVLGACQIQITVTN